MTDRRIGALFVATIFVGSMLLFMAEPMFARMVLPRLGGAPSVWRSALLFYQAMLLAGYVYAHALTRLPPRVQAGVQLALLAAGALTLPIAVIDPPAAWMDASPTVWLIGLFALSIGPVFLAVSAQAPLMQAWFARTGAPPYRLYAASNAGSLIALLAYPLLLEPLLGLRAQGKLWSAGYAVLIVLVAACALTTRDAAPVAREARGAPIAPRVRLRWAAFAAVPSGLLISTTAFLTTDVLAMPLFWVIPLALYLVSFILAFSGRGRGRAGLAALVLLGLGGMTFIDAGLSATIVAVSGLLVLFYVALVLHSELAESAPPAGRLTEFYLWIAVGGVIGGLFSGLIAPLIFDWPYEHPILLIAAALLLPATPVSAGVERLWTGSARPILMVGVPLISVVVVIWLVSRGTTTFARGWLYGAVTIFAFAGLLSIGRPKRFAFQLACLMLTLGGIGSLRLSYIDHARTRSFFGVYKVSENPRLRVRELIHGSTLHGAESLNPALETSPTTYYAPDSGIGRVLAAAPALFGPNARLGVVGLGSGTLACYKRPGEVLTIFEIDPAMVHIARTKFHYLSRCAPDTSIVLGDARLSLGRGVPARFDVLAVDAFSSDAIPVHLLTREAIAVYARALTPGGILMIHISNRFMDLEPVLAASSDWQARVRVVNTDKTRPGLEDSGSDWVMLARDPTTIARALAAMPPGEWRAIRPHADFRPWTDDYTSVLPLLKRPWSREHSAPYPVKWHPEPAPPAR